MCVIFWCHRWLITSLCPLFPVTLVRTRSRQFSPRSKSWSVAISYTKETFLLLKQKLLRSQWLSSLRRGSAAGRLLGLRVRIPPGAWMSVSCVLWGRVLCDGLITCPEESYRLWCVTVRDLETWRMRRPWLPLGCCCQKKKVYLWCKWHVHC